MFYGHSAIAYNDRFERALSIWGEREKKSKFHGVPRTHVVARRRSHRLAAICYSFYTITLLLSLLCYNIISHETN